MVIYGTVAADFGLDGTGDVKFQRDMGVNNRLGPGVAVIPVRPCLPAGRSGGWNPLLLLNWPAELSDALTDWREVAP